eukprot:1393529-Pleurochrysis_carterae.AAC.1
MLEKTAAQAAPPYVGSETSRATAWTPSACAGSAASASMTSGRVNGNRTDASAALRPASPASALRAANLHVVPAAGDSRAALARGVASGGRPNRTE